MAKTIGDYVKIGGVAWNVKVIKITETFNILDTDNAGRVIESGEMKLDRIGTFYGHNITFIRDKASISEYDRLFTFLSRPINDGIQVEIVHNQETISYKAYIASGSRDLKKIDPVTGEVFWDSFTANFVPMKAQVRANDQ